MGGLLASLREAIGNASYIARQAVVSLRYNWGVGIIALVLAISLWVYVTDQGGETRTGLVPGSVPIEAVNVPPGQAVLSLSQDAVTVRVRAPDSVLDDLGSDDFRATVDLSGVTSAEATEDVRVETTASRVDIIDISPARVTVRLESVTSKTVPVRTKVVGTPPRGFEAQNIDLDPEEAAVTGPERLVERVVAVEADVNLTGLRTNFEQTLLLQPRDAQGGTIDGVDVEPEIALVRVQIAQLEFSAPFPVRGEVAGTPALGFNASAIQVNPPFVVVSGTAETLQAIDAVAGIRTEPVSIDGASADVVRTVSLQLPEGARVEQSEVTVRVVISPSQGSFSFSVAPQPVNVPSGLTAALDQASVQVVLGGPAQQLGAIDASDITATVDLTGLGEGVHTVPVNVEAPAGTTLQDVQPAEVQVTLSSG